MSSPEGFFKYAEERYNIHRRRLAGRPKPWTENPILKEFRFCNVFREDDTVTNWVRKYVREPLYDDERVVLALVIARWFNRIETLEILEGGHYGTTNLFRQWNSDYARNRLENHSPLVTGAYMVKTPGGMNKLDGLLQCIDKVADACQNNTDLKEAIRAGTFDTLQGTTQWLCQFPYLGPFMAYEVVTDLRHTAVCEGADDIMTWANPGPGALRGAGRVFNQCPNTYRSNQRELVNTRMQELLKMSQDPKYWPTGFPRWEMREVEHTLCEYDKYERVRLGEGTPKQRYEGAA